MSNAKSNRDNAPRSIADDKNGRFDARLDDHFLANRSLVRRKVENLLLSASFGANSILYAVFLGYLMGLWGLLLQVAWATSFFLLAPFVQKIHQSASLHEFLGNRFGTTTRKLAALCSVLGITYFVGWEIAVANSSLQSVIPSSSAVTTLLVTAVIVAIFYSTRWGRKASGSINVVLNTIKICCLLALLVLMGSSFFSQHGLAVTVLLPPISEAILAVGVVGFITNIIFNISWQFVDNSSWQSISSSKIDNGPGLASSVKRAGLSTLVTVNGGGTLLGAMLRPIPGVDSVNALGQIVHVISSLPTIAMFLMAVLIIFSAISLFDGAILSVTQSLVVDIGLRAKNKQVSLRYARIITLLVGIIAAWGVEQLVSSLGGSIFNMVYIVILTQLSLVGPVVIGLLSPYRIRYMWISIALSLFVACVITIIGTVNQDQNILQLAGTIVTLTSLLCGFVIYLFNRKIQY